MSKMFNNVSYTIQVKNDGRTVGLDCKRLIMRDRKLTPEGARRILVRILGNDTVTVSRVEAWS
jgi:hypothetical protein